MKNNEIKKCTAIVSLCGNYVSKDELNMYVSYVFGSPEYTEIFEDSYFEDCLTKELREKLWGKNKQDLTLEEQKNLDGYVSVFLEQFQYEGYCDYNIYSAIMFENKVYINV